MATFKNCMKTAWTHVKTTFEIASTIVSGVTGLNIQYTEPVKYVDQPETAIYQQADTKQSLPHTTSGDRTGFMIESYAQYEANEKKQKFGSEQPSNDTGISGVGPKSDKTHLAIRIKDGKAEVIVSNDVSALEEEIAKIEQQEMAELDSQPNYYDPPNVIDDVPQKISSEGTGAVTNDYVLPSNAKGVWTGEPGNSYFVPNDPMIAQRCIEKNSFVKGPNGEMTPGIPFENGKVQFDNFAESLNGHDLIGDIPNITEHRNISPRNRDFESMGKTDIGNGSINTEYQSGTDSLSKVYVSGDPVENTQVLMRESKALGDRPYSVRGMNDASNYDQAIASISKDMNMAQSDMRYLIDISGKELTADDTAKLREISERSGIKYEQLVDLTSEKLTIHEQVYTDSKGHMRSEGIVMRSDTHQAIHHEGAVKEVKGKSTGDSFKNDQKDSTDNKNGHSQLPEKQNELEEIESKVNSSLRADRKFLNEVDSSSNSVVSSADLKYMESVENGNVPAAEAGPSAGPAEAPGQAPAQGATGAAPGPAPAAGAAAAGATAPPPPPAPTMAVGGM